MQRFAEKSFWETKNRKMKTLEIRHSREQNSGNAAFCEKKHLGNQKSKKENFGNKTFKTAELQKNSVFRKKNFLQTKNRKMKTLEIKHSKVYYLMKRRLSKKKPSGNPKI